MKSYSIRETIPETAAESLKAYPELLRKLLYYRGIEAQDKAHEFLNPSYETGLHDPFLMKDMDKAVERILAAIERQERILVYSDYDADGIPAAVVMHDFFTAIGYKNFEIYIPHRHTEGYGLHLEAIETFVPKNIKLLITLDCGIVDYDEVARANSLGIDVIVTDHHMPGEKIPPAYAVLNSKQSDCSYPYDMLCGSGVAFKLIQALLQKNRFGAKEGAEKWFLDMVGLATLSDMVPLQGENRVLAHYGLKVLRKSRRPGLIKLLSKIKVKQHYISEDDIGFMITPRINAASRMGIPLDAFKLLSTSDEVEGGMLATHLDAINNERKGLVASTVKEIKKILAERKDHHENKRVIVLGNPNWRPALLGLVANSLAEEYNKPVFLWGREEGMDIKGSCRSDGVIDLVQLMTAAKDSFIEFGGHKFSGGYALSSDKVHTLEDALCAACEKLEASVIEDSHVIDAVLSFDDVIPKNYELIEKLGPFGMNNPKPLFIFEHAVVADVKPFGKAKEHLELSFANSKGKLIKAVGFFMTIDDFARIPRKGSTIHLVATMEKSYFSYMAELRLRIVDII